MIERIRGSSMLTWGLLLGLLAGVVAIAQGILPFFALSDGVDRSLTYGIFVLYLVLYFLAGLLTVRQGAPVSSGAISGLLVAVVSQAVGGLVVLGMVLAAPLAYARSIGQPDYAKQPAALVMTAALGLLIALVVYGTFGAAMGALGGLVLPARRTADQPTARGRGA